jgi:dTDP-4-amino-4,6-dideoxygalactose transaminase
MNNGDSLALSGGASVIDYSFQRYNSIGSEEVVAASKVVESGLLSKFIGAPGEFFLGGPKVKEFEAQAANYFGCEFAITFNSWTSGLIAAVGALDLNPGDEVIVTPWTMSASAIAILHWNAIPVFADIEPAYFCIDPDSVESRITKRTRAIMSVDIFGQAADTKRLREIADRNGLMLITDSAQSPGALDSGKYAGTLSDIGGFSLNYHKHIHTGEGGIAVTNNQMFARRMQLIRNHAEVSLEETDAINNMIGHNFRFGEIESAIGIEQLKKLPSIVSRRQEIAVILSDGLANLAGLSTPKVRPGKTHVYYVYAMTLDLSVLRVKRDLIFSALKAEGVPGLSDKYQNLHLLPMYQSKIAYGDNGFPWTSDVTRKDINYTKGICPIAEDLQDNTYLGFSMCEYELFDDDVYNIVKAFQKVWANLSSLRQLH